MQFTGTLSIRRAIGRNGAFNIGILSTGIAHYVVKDAIIEEFEVGHYAGQFEVTKTFLKSYVYPGRLIIENRAIVSRIELAEDTMTTDSAAVAESDRIPVADVDPVDEEAAPPPASATPSDATPASTPPAPQAEIDLAPPADQTSVKAPSDEDLARMKEQSYATLFGPLWPFGAEVKLDKTIDRLRLRAQIKAMDELGYEFQKLGQVYIKKAA